MVELVIQPARFQSRIDEAPFHAWLYPDGKAWLEFYRVAEGYLLRFGSLADYVVASEESRVMAYPAIGVGEATLQHLYLNQVLPLVLSRLGRRVFHASAIEVPGGAVAFAAESGRGKSTMAASFAVSGFRFLTDDGLLLEPTENGYEVLPSHPSIRLWADSENALIVPGTEIAPPVSFTAKVRFLAGDDVRFCDQPRPLLRTYFLGDGSTENITFQRLSPSEAFIEWVKHSFLLDVEDKARLTTHFQQVTALAKLPIHYRLDYPRRYEDLADVRAAIVEHASLDTN